ncbi:hypothetical protein J7L67_09320 [bacterium]|nr:hypothetical protein [bacterium]
MDFELKLHENLKKIKNRLKSGQIVSSEVLQVLNGREIIIKIQGLLIKAYTDIAFKKNDRAYLYIKQVKNQLRFKVMDEKEYKKFRNKGIDIIF